jgi:hypothetical protein
MVKNTMGGNKAKKMKNSGPIKRATFYPTDGQMYAVADKCHSHSNIEISYIEEDEAGHKHLEIGLGVLRGNIITRIKKINVGDLFIVSKRDFETIKPGNKPKLDIIHKYRDTERTNIINKLPEELRNYISMKAENLDNDKCNVQDEIIFKDNERQVIKNRNKRVNQNNAISTDYLADYDLPPLSSDEEVDL